MDIIISPKWFLPNLLGRIGEHSQISLIKELNHMPFLSQHLPPGTPYSLTSDGPNLAGLLQRVEDTAEPGSVCLSGW